MASFKVLPIMKKIKANGEVPLYLRVIRNRKIQYISLQIYIKPDAWDCKSNSVKPKHRNSARINNYITHKLFEAQDTILESETKNKFISTKTLKDKILGTSNISFINYFEKYNMQQEKLENIGTYMKSKTILGKLKTYIGEKDLSFNDITVSFLKGYEFYLRTELNNKTNTVHSNMKIIRKIFNDAIKEDLIDKSIYPFSKYQLVWDKSNKDQLDESNVNKIINLDLMRGSALDHHRNMFIFSCLSGGLRISDLLLIKWSHFDGKMINLEMFKTKEMVSFKATTKGLEILNIYGSQERKENQNKYIFPFLDSDKNYSKNELFKAMSGHTAYANKSLKKIAKMAQLDKQDISFHWARRTFACLALTKGVSLEHVSKILGHSGIDVTLESYARFAQSDLNKSMDFFDS